MRKIIIIIILFNLSVSASANNVANFTNLEKDYLASNVFTLGMIADNYPFSFEENGIISGFSHDYLKLIKKKSGLKINIEMDSWTNTLNKFKTKKIDLIDLISYTKSREAFANFTEPYFEIPSVVFAKEGDFNNYNGFESLKGKKVGITKDLYYYNTVKNLQLFELIPFEKSADKMKALAYGKVDAIFNNLITGQRYVKNFGFSNIEILGELDSNIVKKEDLRIGIKKEDNILFSIIKKSIQAISIEEKEALVNKWFAARIEINTTPETPFPLTEQEKKYIKEKKIITMCVAPDRLPFEQIDKQGIYKGIGADIIEIISKKINAPIQLVPTKQWSTSLQNIRDRKCDILPVVMKTPPLQDRINFTKPYISEPLIIATKERELFIKDIEAIGVRKVGLLKNSPFLKILKKNHPAMNIVEINSTKEGLLKVQSDELFGYIGTMPVVGYNIQQYSFVDLKIAGKLEYEIKVSIGSRNDEALLNSIMQKALDSISKDKLRTIMGEWIKINVEQSFDYLKLLYISAFFSIIVLLVLYRNRVINRVNGQLASLNKEIENQNKALEALARTDKLTGLYNRVKLDDTLISESNRANRFDHTFGVIMIDIDYFKKINDNFGHQMGDTILQEFSHILESNKRDTDILGRWGGEEFLIISTETDLSGALSLANKIQKAVASHLFMHGEHNTASFGVSIYRKNESIDKVLHRADSALYKAKENGRNRVETR